MNIKIAAATLAFLASMPAANAMTVTNIDKAAHRLTIAPRGAAVRHVMLKPNHFTSVADKAGGRLWLGKVKADYTARTAKVWIKNGKFALS